MIIEKIGTYDFENNIRESIDSWNFPQDYSYIKF